MADEEAMFHTDAHWGGGFYIALNKTLPPRQPFEFHKDESIILLDNDPLSFDSARKIASGELVIYVLTKAQYADKFGPLPIEQSCSVFSVKNNFKRGDCWGTYQQ